MGLLKSVSAIRAKLLKLISEIFAFGGTEILEAVSLQPLLPESFGLKHLNRFGNKSACGK
jgi:hypothetical protein